jgi:hypothetical protein
MDLSSTLITPLREINSTTCVPVGPLQRGLMKRQQSLSGQRTAVCPYPCMRLGSHGVLLL